MHDSGPSFWHSNGTRVHDCRSCRGVSGPAMKLVHGPSEHARRKVPTMTEAERQLNYRDLLRIKTDPELAAQVLSMTVTGKGSRRKRR